VLLPEAYDHLNQIDKVLEDGLTSVVESYGLPCYVTGAGAKGSVIYSKRPVREYRDAVGIDERITYLAWLMQQNRGVFKSPWTKQETWTTSVAHTEDDAQRYIANFEEFAAAVTS
jgi:glutamate-1-semialdehyde 2,1-aminomutase